MNTFLVPVAEEITFVVVCSEYERLNAINPDDRTLEELDQILVHADQCPVHDWRRNLKDAANA